MLENLGNAIRGGKLVKKCDGRIRTVSKESTVGVGRKKVPVKLNVEKDNELWEELKSCRKVVPVYHVTVICAK